jgi:hypothetical protein
MSNGNVFSWHVLNWADSKGESKRFCGFAGQNCVLLSGGFETDNETKQGVFEARRETDGQI